MPHDGLIKFSSPALETVTVQLADILDTLTSSVERLRTKVVETCGSWEGGARDAFVALMDDWNRQEADLRAQQNGLHTGVTAARANFVSAQGAVRRVWGA